MTFLALYLGFSDAALMGLLGSLVTVFLGCPDSLARESGLLLFLSMLSDHLSASLAPSLGCVRHKENPGNSTLCFSLDPRFPSLSAIFSLLFRIFLCLFYIKCPGFLVVSSEKIRKSTSTPSSQKSSYKILNHACIFLIIVV